MDDPWDVKSVRQFGQYTSCMKLNGVPLLPPVLSKECRKEMQYYKLLAKEVEKRISILKPYIDSDSNSSDDTNAPDIPESYLDYEQKTQTIQDDLGPNINQIAAIKAKEKSLDEALITSTLNTELHSLASTKMTLETSKSLSPYLVDFSLNIKGTGGKIKANTNSNSPSPPIEVPERDCDCVNNRELLNDHKKTHTCKCEAQDKEIEEIVNFSFAVVKDKFAVDSFHDNVGQDGPQSLVCKSFTGSLDNIHTESVKSFHATPNLVRQRSYTILNPSPQLMAHLEVQSVNLGVDMSSISMSESLSNLSTTNKKRRSWDLESAKVKWANMALELKKKNLSNPINTTNRNVVKGQVTKRAVSPQPAPRAKAVAAARNKYANLSLKQIPKTELVTRGRTSSPVRGASNKTIILEEPMTFRTGKEPISAKSIIEATSTKTLNHRKEAHEPVTPTTVKDFVKNSNYCKELQSMTPKSLINSESDNSMSKDREGNKSTTPKSHLISESEDPAAKVRELYDKIQNQQLVQMASLIEKQKKEQMMLQQIFEEQNNLLFKQLKTICPKSPVEAKEAWVDKTQEADMGPVSLSQLINPQSFDQASDSPVTSTLTDANNYILNQCDSVLKKSRDISAVIKLEKCPSQNGTKIQSPKSQNEGSLTRTHSPNPKGTPTSRRLTYDTSVSTERDYDPILTDRTNDTMADLNVTFPSDSEEYRSVSHNRTDRSCAQNITMKHASTTLQSTDSAIKCMEQAIKNSMRSSQPMYKKVVNYQPTPKQQAAAAKIVAYVKGYLVRRLMKTARVQSTVQTIKDALLCALQLHQDREGIRGADVDLHRRLIQQITAACYTLHDTFIASTAAERCAMIAADRGRRASLASRSSSKNRHSDLMSQSHSGVFLPRPKRFCSSSTLMTQSNYETYGSDKSGRARYMPSPRRRPWR